ncbi:uncharacterized protein THITE_2089960 [Thermothielavioides terrestris NRRL 8126]|uniref:Heterokaryon incompatibility domain-containing protein n=1 Tax=Thermothielavioides terrestris (strain ATCC 38088 / NRRL 8126) TaxID=578455 RepID=G2R6H1_THETT|nr:uncharacterized protein THITE_2089960 [Thermothielavioides terrestris NRRL 8126]AEO68452.1 hypothetical protein THITE_2089960 [Thermothielavioides terrestris NRRL 8126]
MSGSDDVLYNFKSYWDRTGWARHPLTGHLSFHDRRPEEIAQSLQTSLYFGTLISIFGRVGIPVRTRDFLSASSPNGEVFVRTTKLPHLVADWLRREGVSSEPAAVGDVNDPRWQRGQNIIEMLNWAFYYLNMYSRETQTMAKVHKERMQLVELSIKAMAESLCSVASAIYGCEIRVMPSWGSSPVLAARLRDNGWCDSDSPFFPESMTRASVSADYYFGGLRCPRARGDHSGCSTAICNEYCRKITPGDYEQVHTAGCRGCKSELVPEQAIHLVEKGQVPVLQWDGDTIHVSAGDDTNAYVTVSHVWSDGLGNNDKENSLWACQLSRIQSLVNELGRGMEMPGAGQVRGEDGNRLVPFWIDTLCVPVGDENRHPGGNRTRDLRKEAIGQMADIYRRARQVLVLDSFILSLPRSADVIDKYLRIHLSNWHHRLWTMQEGQLARRLVFQFRDGAESFEDMRREEMRAFDRYAPQNLCSPLRLLCAVELEAFYAGAELGADAGRDVSARMRSCARYLRSRETSRSEDESVCVANILGLPAAEVLQRDGADARMARFYDLVGRFDPRIIFHNHPRLGLDGYRWAPRSFLRQLPDLINVRDTGFQTTPQLCALLPNGGGLPVRFGGFEFSSDALPRPGSPKLFKPMTDGRGWAPRWPGDTKVAWFASTYEMVVQDVLEETPPLGPRQRWAVILPGVLQRDYLPPPPFRAIMGIIDADIPACPATAKEIRRTVWTRPEGNVQYPAYTVPGRIPVRYVCRVEITLEGPETVPQDAPFIWVWAYGRQQEWCIR